MAKCKDCGCSCDTTDRAGVEPQCETCAVAANLVEAVDLVTVDGVDPWRACCLTDTSMADLACALESCMMV